MKIVNNVLVEVEESDLQKVEVKQTLFARLKNGKEYKNVLNIPEDVVSISGDAFKNVKDKINEIVMPEGLTTLENHSLSGLIFLQNVKVPSTLENMGESVFSGCQNLRSIDLSDTKLKTIPDKTFSDCNNIESVKLPSNIEKIGGKAFLNCNDLEDFVLPKDLKEVGEKAFQNCTSIKNINFSEGLTKLGNDSFSGCVKLRKVTLPSSLKKIGEGAFCDCSTLQAIDIPSGVTEIEADTFAGCLALSKVNIPESVTSIGEAAFKFCTALNRLDLPKNIIEIENDCFSGCSTLQKINIPESVTSIGENSFFGCKSLTELLIPQGVENIGRSAFESCKNISNITLPAHLKVLSKGLFKSCYNLKEINIPDSVERIDDEVFEDCLRLKSVKFGANVKKLGESIFKNCSSLNQISNFPQNITAIPDFTFSGCESLINFDIPASVKSIGNDAFSNCFRLNSIAFSNNLQKIGQGAFDHCKSLRSVVVPDSVDYIGESAFSGCEGLNKIVLSNSLKEIKQGTFKDCYNLFDVKFPSELEYIDSFAFNNCRLLEKINLPNSVLEIGEDAFAYCENLSEVNMPKQLKVIDYGAFSSTSIGGELVMPENLQSIGEYAFSGCSNITGIVIPNGIKKISNFAFSGCNIDSLFVPNSVEQMGDFSNTGFNFITKMDDGYMLSCDEPEGSQKTQQIRLSPTFLSSHWTKLNTILREQNNDKICDFYNNYLVAIEKQYADEFIDSHNFTFFKKLNINVKDPEKLCYIYNFLYNLGAMNAPIVNEKGKIVDYAQKVSEFLMQEIRKDTFDFSVIPDSFRNMEMTGFKKGFTDFFLSEYNALMNVEEKNPGFIAKCYNEFENVQRTNTSNRGGQRQLNPTVEKFVAYFREVGFSNVNEETSEIARTLKHYFTRQASFDEAVAIDRERRTRNTPNNILSTPLKEDNIFTTINDYAEKIKILRVDTIKELAKIAEKEFTFEWLEKNDPQNFILGKLCNCCAHIEGNGFGIMRASIIEPNIQNLVIRNSRGEIIAKSTLYVNTQEGYGVCNDVEVADSVSSDKYELIYQKFILGIESFAEQYNKEHPDKPLKQINIGMNERNDLRSDIAAHHKKARTLLKAPNYGEYGMKYREYNGDSSEKQHIIWQKEEKENEM